MNIRRAAAVLGVAALAGTLAASARPAAPVDHVWLSLGPVPLDDGWSLTAGSTSSDFDTVTGDEILGVTLERKPSSRVRELHALRAHLDEATFRFDGRVGRWQSSGPGGKGSAVDMRIVANGEPRDVPANESLPFGCRGSFSRVPVLLTGTFVVHAGTRAFKTIRRGRLSGVITYNRGGPVECGPPAPPHCEPSTYLTVSGGSAVGFQSLTIDRQGRGVVVQFTETGSAWSHVVALSRVDVLAGEPPSIRVRFPAKLPVEGSATFAGLKETESIDDRCRTTTTEGAFDGVLRVRFSAWGGRVFGAAATRGRLTARYRVTAPA